MLIDSLALKPQAFPDIFDGNGYRDEYPCAEQNAFRQGMQHMAGGVAVVTTSDEEGTRYGTATTSVCSLTPTPPTMIACVARNSALGLQIPLSRRFCINILAMEQRAVAESFGAHPRPETDHFGHGHWKPGVTGSPVLSGALAAFECTVDLIYGYSSHLLVVGKVQHTTGTDGSADPLVYFSQQFTRVQP